MSITTDADSDKLLRQAGAFKRGTGIRTEQSLQKEKQRHCVSLNEDCLPQKVCTQLDGIKWGSVRAVLRKSDCHTRAITCLELSLMGFTYRQIAEKNYIAVSPTTVQRDINCAIGVLRRDQTLGIVEILCEVFHLPRSIVLDIIKK